ncbi:dioxygenase [Ponticaulis sp.]|uniref:dioxygenase family protein n=1 Tax=Ponticaulis sp. TaxID=2020902 RepID=UPI000B75A0B2|nr:dioxygenase [Ponticaulis sp.]MAI91191.1 catechol 1,2-dioxygenase [Ponticaulis sp.]OUX98505.1 MAG: catechol 1,2-dioxygenase [Hyphomonadaceae bacterium TMED5]|tara:strand:- start:99841 stop:100731 length:891 start_codon:yes stop_codon:yes gene_type:complete
MDQKFISSEAIQNLLDRASGMGGVGGDDRLQGITRELLEALFRVLAKYEVTDSELWDAIKYFQEGIGEIGLIVPGIGLEHYMDLLNDERDRLAGRDGGTPRTIEGPLYVAGAPLVEGDVNLTSDPDDTENFYMSGQVTGPDGEPVKDVILHVWHANSKGFYSHFDPTGEQTEFNNRRRIKLGDDGRYSFHSKMPSGYSVPPQGATEKLMNALGRHGNRPAHVHFFIEAPGYRTLTTQINFGDDPFAHDDFAFGTREGLLPVPNRQGNSVTVGFDFELQRATAESEEEFSSRTRASV